MWESAGMARNAPGLEKAIGQIQDLRDDFENLLVPGNSSNLNVELERAGRVRDFLDFGELLCRDALEETSLVEDIFVKNIRLKKEKRQGR